MLGSRRKLNFSIDSSLAEEGLSPLSTLTRRTVKKALERYFGFTLAHLTSLLVEFIHQQASIGIRPKDLMAYKDLLCVANAGNVSKEVLLMLVKKIKRGPLARKWNLVLSTDLVNDVARYDDLLSRGVEPHLIPTPYFDARLPIPSSSEATSNTEYESLDLNQPSPYVDKIARSRVPMLIVNDERGRAIDDPHVSLTYSRTPRRSPKAYTPVIFRNVKASTPEPDINMKLDANWRKRMGLPPKFPRSSYYEVSSSDNEVSRVPYMSKRELQERLLRDITPKALHKRRMKDLVKEIHGINLYRPQYRHKFI